MLLTNFINVFAQSLFICRQKQGGGELVGLVFIRLTVNERTMV